MHDINRVTRRLVEQPPPRRPEARPFHVELVEVGHGALAKGCCELHCSLLPQLVVVQNEPLQLRRGALAERLGQRHTAR